MSTIHLSLADVGELEEEYVLRALRSGWVTALGPEVEAFEQEVARRVGVAHALALNSGTAALHLALLDAGAAPGKHVIVPTMTFAATANAVMYTGATPVFVDSQATDGNVDPELLLEAVRSLQSAGHDVVAAIPVDLFGRCCNYRVLEPGLRELGVELIEDAAEALGASHLDRGAGSFGRCAALSFNGNKIMTTSGGGMLVSDDAELVERARYLSTQARQPVPWYEHLDVGYNYRMSNILAALGRAQLSRLDSMIARRRAIRDRYERGLVEVEGLRILGRSSSSADKTDNCWLTSIVLEGAQEGAQVDAVLAELSRCGIEARHLWKPMHAQPVFAGFTNFLNGASDRLFARGMNLPSGASLSDEDVDRVIATLKRIIAA